MDIHAWLNSIFLVVTLIVLFFKSGWGARGNKEEILEAVHKGRIEAKEDIARFSREVGETIIAIRQKIQETELWNRDTFIRRKTVDDMMTALNRHIDDLCNRLEARFDKIEAKHEALLKEPRG
jgi:hypothetical protein